MRLCATRKRSTNTDFSVPLTDAIEVPMSFSDENFKCPEIAHPLVLQQRNPFPNDASIQFDQESHTYEIHGKRVQLSVTRAVDFFFEQFDAPVVVSKMINGKSWPRAEYWLEAENRAMTVQEILKAWDANGCLARNQGTWMHYNIERFLNNLPYDSSLPEMKYFEQFYSEKLHGRVEPVRTEWRIASPDHGLAGTVDFIGKWKENNKYIVIDWKRSKGFPDKLDGWGTKSARYPLNHLKDSKRVKYSLQLNLYRYILEKHYGITIDTLICASFHSDLNAYSYFEAEDVRVNIYNMFCAV